MTETIELVGPEVILPVFQSRYEALVKKDPELTFVDPLIRDLIKHMNDIEGVSTSFSCQGRHNEDADYEDDGYVMFVCKDTRFIEDIVMSIWRRIQMNNQYRDLLPDIHLYGVNSTPRVFIKDDTETVWYRSYVLSWAGSDDHLNALWCDVITEAVKSLKLAYMK